MNSFIRTSPELVVQAFSLHTRVAREILGLRTALLLCLTILTLTGCSSNRAKLAYSDSSAADWHTPRADYANTGRVASGVLDEPYTIAWSTHTGGVASSEPIVRDGLIFFSGLDRRVEVYDLATGERRFRKRFDGPVIGVIPGDSTFGVLVDQVERRFFTFDLRTAREKRSFKVSTVSAPPRVLTDTTMLIGTWHGRLSCLTYDGRELWQANGDGPIMNAPAVGDTAAYMASGRVLYAINTANGDELWKHRVSAAIEGAPALGDHVYFGATDSFATALNLSNGKVVWTTRLGGGVFATPAVGDELIYFASNDGMLNALDKSDGTIRWAHSTGAIANLSPTLCGEYLLTTSRQATVTMLSASSGQQLWSDTTLSAQATASPVVIGDRILLSDSRRVLMCLIPASQSPLADPGE